MVERNLAKVEAAGSNPVFRSNGDVAEWLRSGLQNRLHEFDSRRRLKEMIAITGSGEFLPGIKNAD